jgi:hypothetical protein
LKHAESRSDNHRNHINALKIEKNSGASPSCVGPVGVIVT